MNGFFFTLIVFLGTLGQVATDIYISTLNAIGKSLQTSTNNIQMTVPVYLIGFALSQLFWGPLSDRYGRKRPLLSGLFLLIGGSAFCAAAFTLSQLLIGRFLQGLGGGCAITLSRAILRDLFSGKELAKFSSYMAIFATSIMASAPMLGSILFYLFGWRAPFFFLTFSSLTLFFLVLFFLEETNRHTVAEHWTWTYFLNGCASLAQHRDYFQYTLSGALGYAAIAGWLTVGPVLIQTKFEGDEILFGWLCLGTGIFYACAGLINGRNVAKKGHKQLLRFGQIMVLAGGLTMALFSPTQSLFFLLVPLFLTAFGTGFIFPNTLAGALSPFPKQAGTAGSMYGFLQIFGGVLGSCILFPFPDTSQLPLASLYIGVASIPFLWRA